MQSEERPQEASHRWVVRLFGMLEVQKPDGSILRIGGKKAGALLAQLALNPGRIHTREALADLLWPESDPVNGRTRLRQEISALRTLLQTGDDADTVLRISRNDLQMREELVWTDAVRFRSLLQEASQLVSSEQAERQLAAAISLYRADLLTEYSEFISERLDFAQYFEKACRELAALQKKRSDHKSSEETLKCLLAHDPLLEEAHVDLMRLYAVMDQPTKIRRQYEELKRALRQELNAQPSATTSSLLEELLQSRVTLSQRPAEVNEALPSAAENVAVAAPGFFPPHTGYNGVQLHSNVSAHSSANTRVYRRPHLLFSLFRDARSIAHYAGGFCLILLLCWRYLHLRPTNPQPTGLQFGKERWIYSYRAQPGEKLNSEARAMTRGENGACYVTGLIQTEFEDTDILTVKLSAEGKQIWAHRYSSDPHNCDRAYSIAADGSGGVYVAGETYMPTGHGKNEGWRLVLLHYATDGNRDASGNAKPDWVQHSKCITQNAGHRIRVCADGRGGAYVGGTALINGVPQMLILRYDSKGKQLWQHIFRTGDRHPATFNDLTVTQNGPCACGTVLSSNELDGAHDNVVTLCLKPTGEKLWVQYHGGPNNNGGAAAIEHDSHGNLYVGETFYMGDPAVGGTGANPGITKFDADGTHRWTRIYAGLGPNFQFCSLSMGPAGSFVTVAGNVSSINGDCYGALINYDPRGSLRWARKYLPVQHRTYGVTGNADIAVDWGWLVGGVSNQPQITSHLDNKILALRYGPAGEIL